MGIWWPAADSAKLRVAAQAWREMARAIDGVDSATQSAVLNVLADNQGPAMDAFGAYWQKWSGGTGYLPTCSQACTAMGKALDDYAQAVDDARVKVEQLVAEIGTAVVLGVVLGICTVGMATAAAGAVSAGLMASAALVGIELTATAGGIIAGVLVGATFGAVEAMAIDIVAIQPEKILLFHDQKDFSWSDVLQWGEMGAAGRVFGRAPCAGHAGGGHYNVRTTTETEVVYRGGAAGGGKNAYGRWFSLEPSTSRAQVRIELAVKPDWIDPVTGELGASSPVESLYALEVPPGTTMYEGPTSNQGGIYVGGRTQVFIPEPWNFKVLPETPLP